MLVMNLLESHLTVETDEGEDETLYMLVTEKQEECLKFNILYYYRDHQQCLFSVDNCLYITH